LPPPKKSTAARHHPSIPRSRSSAVSFSTSPTYLRRHSITGEGPWTNAANMAAMNTERSSCMASVPRFPPCSLSISSYCRLELLLLAQPASN
jgi:hypothetical protein